MMIRINLLPTRQVKKREMGRQILVVAAGVLFAACAANWLWLQSREEVRSAGRKQIASVKAQVEELQKKIGEVNDLAVRKKKVEEKLAVLNNLKKGRSGPVKMMDALAVAIPKKVWISSFKERDQRVSIDGTGFSHEDVAEMMRSLTNVVWTPKGMGRLVEQRKDVKTSRVELVSGEGALEDFPVTDVKFFFDNINLKKATQKDTTARTASTSSSIVNFEITMSANYAI